MLRPHREGSDAGARRRRAAAPAITELHPTTPPRAHDGTRRNFAARKFHSLAASRTAPLDRAPDRAAAPPRPQPKYLKFCQDYNQLASVSRATTWRTRSSSRT